MVIRINTQLPQGFVFVLSDLPVQLIKEVSALGVNVHDEGTQLVELKEPGGFDPSQLVVKGQLLYEPDR